MGRTAARRTKLNYLTTGEMAELNHVTKRTMWLYHDLGLLVPEKIDPNTGYHYYSMRQCARLDLILYLKSIGLTLSQIKEILSEDGRTSLLPILDNQILQLQEEQKRISDSLFHANLIRSRLAFLSANPEREKPRLEYLPERKIFRCCPEAPKEAAADELHGWERLQNSFHRYLKQQRTALPVYFIGRIYPAEALLHRDFSTSEVFTYVSENFDAAAASFIPQGYYMTVVAEDETDQEPSPSEARYCSLLLDEASRRGYRVCGEGFCEILSETRGSSVVVRLIVPVEVPAGSMVGV